MSGHVTSGSAVVPPIKPSPSFQYVNFKKYTSPEPIFVKIVKIDRYADKNLPEKNRSIPDSVTFDGLMTSYFE